MSVNPRFYKGSSLPEKEKVVAAGSVTWKAGQPGRSTDSGWTPCVSNASQINGVFAVTQPTATTAGDKVWVHRITSADQMFVMNVTSAGTDTKAGSAVVGSNYGYAVNGSVGTISIGNDSTEILHVYDLLANKEGIMNDTSDVPAKLIVGVVASALTAEGTGM